MVAFLGFLRVLRGCVLVKIRGVSVKIRVVFVKVFWVFCDFLRFWGVGVVIWGGRYGFFAVFACFFGEKEGGIGVGSGQL